jgi:hypothetical protein
LYQFSVDPDGRPSRKPYMSVENIDSSRKLAMKTTPDAPPQDDTLGKEHGTLKYSLLGPSLTKSGQENVDQTKVWLKKSHEVIV